MVLENSSGDPEEGSAVLSTAIKKAAYSAAFNCGGRI
jgi:hypothetical protein